mmetsp:Transcript_2262/g.5582  ORF Transcript_2262/g.5582 Transcript_2262/m.5582 type:complete len:191 (-) Transcript_2262:393-965(-)|eukprot:CAMPEP_0181101382 /NCGR_PEP_ID=MMETSP1071-20121207/13721_1 /TAXON_ID=35127 /ORGANISM="Thalassiosira sp., Strain NH16" /LENGTH=190 /DNA_ID=CAMNT_0023184223 /DNA_START=112 /DNA_END=684 /DNA_ORIENTATION=+
MISKAFVASILSFAVVTGASSTPDRRLRQNDRALQASLGCLTSGSTSASQCCPRADPNDGLCTLLWCLNPDDMTLNDGCSCEQITRTCDQLSSFAFIVPGLWESCEGARQCCGGWWSITKATNEAYDGCIGAKLDRGMAVPNLDSFFPDGVPSLSDEPKKMFAQEKPNIDEAMSLPYGAENDGPTRMRRH